MPEYRKKLIEVALPLEAINKESTRENYIYKGNPSAVHKWWSAKPLATARAVLFAQLVDDPSSCPDEFPTETMQQVERERLFELMKELVKWENMNNEGTLHKARVEIARSVARDQRIYLPRSLTSTEVLEALNKYCPPLLDPFCGGGSIPLEGLRLGMNAYACDINPVAVLISKSHIEITPKFADCPPVMPEVSNTLVQREWQGGQGLAEDIRYYGRWMCEEALKRLEVFYPKVVLPKEYGGSETPVMAWLWVRTITCPNPACAGVVPLTSKWSLSSKRGKEVWAYPIVNDGTKNVQFEIRPGKGTSGGTITRQGAKCLHCGVNIPLSYIRFEGQAGRMETQLLALVIEGPHGRLYLAPTADQENIAKRVIPSWSPEAKLSTHPQYMSAPRYGMTEHRHLYTERQLATLATLSQLVLEVRNRILVDAIAAKVRKNGAGLNDEESEASAYADAVATFLAFACDKYATYGCALATWYPNEDRPSTLFSRQTISVAWDFAELNPFVDVGGSFIRSVSIIADAIESTLHSKIGHTLQRDAMTIPIIHEAVISTDPPYYDNVPYADLSDFFYVWLRHSLGSIYPNLFQTVLTPKGQELIADQYRHVNRSNARNFFEEGLHKVFANIRKAAHSSYPLTIYYAFKQVDAEDTNNEQTQGPKISASTGWETMLAGLLDAGFSISGTWPMRTERSNRTRSLASNVLASSIVLVCRPLPADAPLTTRRDFLNALKRELPRALKDLQRGNIAPVDLAQAAIGPGMAIFSRYSKVLESDGTEMRVRTALQLINQTLDEVLAEQEGEYDADTRWAIAWFEQFGMDEGPYGVAETLSKAKNTAVGALVDEGILRAQGGKARLLRRDEFSNDWNPATVKRLTVWEITQRLIRALQMQGDIGAAAILGHVGTYSEVARDLAYRLYTICERKRWADEALAFNSLVVEWSDISGEAERLGRTTAEQANLFS